MPKKIDMDERKRSLAMSIAAANGAALATVVVSISNAANVSRMYQALAEPGKFFAIGLLAAFSSIYLDAISQRIGRQEPKNRFAAGFWRGVDAIDNCAQWASFFAVLAAAVLFFHALLIGLTQSAKALASFPS